MKIRFCLLKFQRIIRALFSSLTFRTQRALPSPVITPPPVDDDGVVSIEDDSEDEDINITRSCSSVPRPTRSILLSPQQKLLKRKYSVSFSPSTAKKEFEKDSDHHYTNPFFNFLAELRIEMHKKQRSSPLLTRQAGELWRQMSNDQKLPYVVYARKKQHLVAHMKQKPCQCQGKTKSGLKRISRLHLGRQCRRGSKSSLSHSHSSSCTYIS